MSFGGFVENNSGGGGGVRNIGEISYNNERMPFGSFSQPRLVTTPTLAKSMFNSSGLSLALQTNIDGQEDVNRSMHENFEQNGLRRSREEEQSRSGSDNLDGVSGDEQDADDKPPRKKRYHRHTPQQIQELEALFKECPHPDEKQRLELSKRLCLETRQVKFWFQNRRTQMKTQLERHENSLLRQENDKLRAENMSIRDAMRNPICSNCGGPAIIGEISLEEQHLRIENARLKDELDRVCALAGKFLGRPISSLPNSSLELGVGGNNNGFNVMNNVSSALPDFSGGMNNNPLAIVSPSTRPTTLVGGFDRSVERSMFLELALAAMDELVKMAQTSEPLWIRSLEGGREILNHDEYSRTFTPCIGLRPNGFVSEASRETGMVIINSLALVETLMDSDRWIEMFPCIIARTSTTEVISNGINGTRNGALQLMQAELHVLSPLVPVREINFLRFCKQHAEGVWAVVDVSVDTIRETSGATSFMNCRKLPSGCVVQDMPNGYSKVTWVEHAEYEENTVHQLYRPLLSSGMGFGAARWVATLQRQCECLAILMSSAAPSRDHSAITAGGRRSMLKLAQRMTNNFCAGVCASTVHKWNKLSPGNVDEDVRVMTRKSVDDPGEPPGIVLSAATSVWLPVSPQRLFDFLRDERLRSEWDILSNGGPMQEMAHIAKGQDHGNCVSLLRASAMNSNQSSMLILQETCIDEAGSLVVYAPVDIPAMHVVMNGGDSAYVALLPSGFAVVPDGPGSRGPENGPTANGGEARVSGSLLTVAFQILVNSLPTAKLTVESVETVNIANKIKSDVEKEMGRVFKQFQVIESDAIMNEKMPKSSSYFMKIRTDDQGLLKLRTTRKDPMSHWMTVVDEFHLPSSPFESMLTSFDSKKTGFDSIQKLADSIKSDVEKMVNRSFKNFDVTDYHPILTDPKHTSYYMRIKTDDNGHVKLKTIKKTPNSDWETHVEEYERGKGMIGGSKKMESLEGTKGESSMMGQRGTTMQGSGRTEGMGSMGSGRMQEGTMGMTGQRGMGTTGKSGMEMESEGQR